MPEDRRRQRHGGSGDCGGGRWAGRALDQPARPDPAFDRAGLTARLLVARLEQGESIALVSDAGTPLISDPGYRVVRAVIAAGFRVLPVPGPSAIIAALSVSGLPTDRFTFEGFLPARGGPRRARLARLAGEPRSRRRSAGAC